ncbi:hypothetical protein L208DRAFT_1408103, partial [Tricholoma matsutake]
MTSWYMGVGPLLPSLVPSGHPHRLVPFCHLVSSLLSGTPGSGGWALSALRLPCRPRCSHTPYSPRKQLLMAVLGVLVVISIVGVLQAFLATTDVNLRQSADKFSPINIVIPQWL